MATRALGISMTIAAALLASAGVAPAAPLPAPCDRLDGDARARAARLMAQVQPHDCCDGALSECVAADRPSRLVLRLAAEVCRRVAAREDDKAIVRDLQRRAESMLGLGAKAAIDTSAVDWAGAPAAPVEAVAYVCTRCPYCAVWLPKLYRAVAPGGPLHGKVRLAVRLFPLSSHQGSKEGGLALEAARALGEFWPYTLLVMSHHDDYAVDKLATWAREVGLDAAAFEARYRDAATRKALVASKKEGIRNGLERTPTLFIAGKRYTADLDLPAVVDALLEQADRQAGALCQP
ncbi:MAG: hypothetical protein CSA66_03160 [Proteobacteria bacterium]|nr:MAG: hypothetical protein CSA66_03160 [Pseudomonadota bacterium]